MNVEAQTILASNPQVCPIASTTWYFRMLALVQLLLSIFLVIPYIYCRLKGLHMSILRHSAAAFLSPLDYCGAGLTNFHRLGIYIT